MDGVFGGGGGADDEVVVVEVETARPVDAQAVYDRGARIASVGRDSQVPSFTERAVTRTRLTVRFPGPALERFTPTLASSALVIERLLFAGETVTTVLSASVTVRRSCGCRYGH